MQVPSFSLVGKTTLVTGGNGGIGLGFARGLVAHGANVVIWGTNADKNAAAAAELTALSKETNGGSVASRVCDVGDQEQVIAGFADAAAQFGRIDAVFVNAGIAGRGIPFHEMSADEWHRVMRVNLDGAFFTAQEACRHMMVKGGGSIVFTTSGSALYGAARSQHYGGSKAALLSISKAIAVEFARHGIRSNCVLPGWIESDMTHRQLESDAF
ncbi:MAG: SDR family NAD(P)-dependent oxidoreductase, partial [Acidobacteria bacterium]|nr:SDR family NAD(P)-dependent oxidoreductase [Acidobacteriota bacterium]